MKRPYITLKFAQTLDGKIAAEDKSSRWISGLPARRLTHKLRAECDAVLVGVNTVLEDDPSLTVRLVKGKNPARIVIDRRLRVPPRARVIRSAGRVRTIIITTPGAPKAKLEKLRRRKVEFLIAPVSMGGNIDIKRIIRILYRKGIRRILVEGGSKVNRSFLKAGLADRVVAVISPKILGSGLNSVADLGIRNIKAAVKLRPRSVKRLGNDIVYIASPAGK